MIFNAALINTKVGLKDEKRLLFIKNNNNKKKTRRLFQSYY